MQNGNACIRPIVMGFAIGPCVRFYNKRRNEFGASSIRGFGNTDETVLLEYCVRNYAEPQEIISSQQFLSISHVLHTHLHLDHCGGSFSANIHCEPEKTFPAAQYIVGTEQLQTALHPEALEQDSFQPEIIKAISSTPNLKSISSECFIFPWLEVQLYNGHTRGMLIPVIHTPEQSIAFVGDLIPSVAHLQLQSTMSYDMNQVLALAEREEFLDEAYENEYVLFFQHDAYHECCSLKKENGRILPHRFFKLNELEY